MNIPPTSGQTNQLSLVANAQPNATQDTGQKVRHNSTEALRAEGVHGKSLTERTISAPPECNAKAIAPDILGSGVCYKINSLLSLEFKNQLSDYLDQCNLESSINGSARFEIPRKGLYPITQIGIALEFNSSGVFTQNCLKNIADVYESYRAPVLTQTVIHFVQIMAKLFQWQNKSLNIAASFYSTPYTLPVNKTTDSVCWHKLPPATSAAKAAEYALVAPLSTVPETMDSQLNGALHFAKYDYNEKPVNFGSPHIDHQPEVCEPLSDDSAFAFANRGLVHKTSWAHCNAEQALALAGKTRRHLLIYTD